MAAGGGCSSLPGPGARVLPPFHSPFQGRTPGPHQGMAWPTSCALANVSLHDRAGESWERLFSSPLQSASTISNQFCPAVFNLKNEFDFTKWGQVSAHIAWTNSRQILWEWGAEWKWTEWCELGQLQRRELVWSGWLVLLHPVSQIVLLGQQNELWCCRQPGKPGEERGWSWMAKEKCPIFLLFRRRRY